MRRRPTKADRAFFRCPGSAGCAAVLGLAILALASVARAGFVDRIVATVNNEVITASELEQTTALNERLGMTGKNESALRAETLDGLVTRRLLVQEARRLRFVDITDQEVDAEAGKLEKRLGSADALTAFMKTAGMNRAELDRMIGEQLLVQRFIEKKFGLFVRVTREDAQGFFDSHPGEFRGKRFQDVQKDIVTRLADERLDKQLDQYKAELRARADIRINDGGG